MLLCVCLFTGGCSQNKDQPSATHNQTPATEAASHTDHTPQVLTPQADGTKTFTTDTAVIDISHTQEGYIMAKYTGSNAKPKLQLTGTTRTLLHISTILNHYMLGFIIAFLVLLIICMILYHTDLGRVLFLGQELAMTVASGRVANCLYLVLSSGLDNNIGLTLARELVNNPHMQALIDKCHENIRHGESFDKGLLLSGIFSQMYASWIVIGSRTGEMESIVSQREINTDTASYLTALRAALRQINGIIYTSAAENMIAIDSSILQLYKDGRIDKHTAILEAVNPEIMSKRLNLL
jgi:type II secretory pathway, component pulF